MLRSDVPKELTLKSLELFQVCAEKGSLQAAAKETGLAVGTVSYHLKTLEQHLGVPLFDHSRRPMRLTPKGQRFLRDIEAPLRALRKAKAEASSGDVLEASHLRVGTIEDFDSDITPDLAVYMTNTMPACDFMFHTDVSASIFEKLQNSTLDIGVMASPSELLRGLREIPFLRDPFVLVLPVDAKASAEEIFARQADLKFLRYASHLLISRQIDAHLKRLKHTSRRHFECSNNQTLMAMVAAGAGWTITTPLLFSRAKRFHKQVRMHPFPDKPFARSLSMVLTPDCSNAVADLVGSELRKLTRQRILEPIWQSTPWLKGDFHLIDQDR